MKMLKRITFFCSGKKGRLRTVRTRMSACRSPSSLPVIAKGIVSVDLLIALAIVAFIDIATEKCSTELSLIL